MGIVIQKLRIRKRNRTLHIRHCPMAVAVGLAGNIVPDLRKMTVVLCQFVDKGLISAVCAKAFGPHQEYTLRCFFHFHFSKFPSKMNLSLF